MQYWHFQTAKAAQIHFEMLQKNTLIPPEPVGVASEAYYLQRGDTTSLVSLHLDNHAVVSLTCDIENCHVPQLMRWTKLIHTRVAQ